jgi:hypothetical protein
MKLSEALRAGAVGRKQGIGFIYCPSRGEYCAVGMILAALGVEFGDEKVIYISLMQGALIRERCGVDDGAAVGCPCGCTVPTTPLAAIIAANDKLGWSAERIAAWLEGQGL